MYWQNHAFIQLTDWNTPIIKLNILGAGLTNNVLLLYLPSLPQQYRTINFLSPGPSHPYLFTLRLGLWWSKSDQKWFKWYFCWAARLIHYPILAENDQNFILPAVPAGKTQAGQCGRDMMRHADVTIGAVSSSTLASRGNFYLLGPNPKLLNRSLHLAIFSRISDTLCRK